MTLQLCVLLNGNSEAPNALQPYFKYRELNQSHHNEIEKCTQPFSALHKRTSAHVMCFINLEYNPSDMNNNSKAVYGGHMSGFYSYKNVKIIILSSFTYCRLVPNQCHFLTFCEI